MMLCKNNIEKLNIVAFRGQEMMAELLGLCFFSSGLFLCCALHMDMYYETSKYWSSKARLLRF
jgi:hypothetical protein